MDDKARQTAIGTMIVICLVLVLPAACVLVAVRASSDSTVLMDVRPALPGYTCSLLFFVVPGAALSCWFFRYSDPDRRRVFWISLALLVPIGIVLDLGFGPRFFTWPNSHATLGWTVPAVGGRVPVEEIVFFVSGFGFLLLTYVWSSEYWLAEYRATPADVAPLARAPRRVRRLRVAMLLLTLACLAAAVLYKKFASSTPAGFPGYLTYVMVVAILPPVYCFPRVCHVINWQAFSFTQLAMVLICLLWEVTLAAPLQWWAFQPDMMTGIYISAWSNLPIEEPFVWLASPFTVIVTYETVRLYQRKPRHSVMSIPVTGEPPSLVSEKARAHES